MAVALLATTCVACTDGQKASPPAPSHSPSSSASPSPSAADEERDGVVKAGPTVRLRETDEFGIVVRTERRSGVVRVTVDRVDSLTGEEGEQAAAARGVDYSNDHFEVNDNARTRVYTLAQDVDIWLANPSDAGSPKPLKVSEWRDYVASTRTRERPPMFHFDVEDGRVIGVEEQYFP